MDEKFVLKMGEKLRNEREITRNELKSFAQKSKTSKGGDWKTRYPNFDGDNFDIEQEADEVEAYEDSLPVEHILELKLIDINLALEKIKNGKYGICEKCGKEISNERLNVYPEARLCSECEHLSRNQNHKS